MAAVAGFDIYNPVLGMAGADGALYSVDLLTGKATARGTFAHGDQVSDIAIPLNQD